MVGRHTSTWAAEKVSEPRCMLVKVETKSLTHEVYLPAPSGGAGGGEGGECLVSGLTDSITR
jgi:hypothetical protein